MYRLFTTQTSEIMLNKMQKFDINWNQPVLKLTLDMYLVNSFKDTGIQK